VCCAKMCLLRALSVPVMCIAVCVAMCVAVCVAAFVAVIMSVAVCCSQCALYLQRRICSAYYAACSV